MGNEQLDRVLAIARENERQYGAQQIKAVRRQARREAMRALVARLLRREA